jgi:hypothetical protein
MNSNSTDPRQIRKFGAVALVFFGVLSGIGFWRDSPIPAYLFGILALLGMGFLLLPAPLRPLYEKWLRIANAIGRVMTVVILTLAYYFSITPTAFLKKLISGVPISGKPDKEAPSYWVPRAEPAQPKERFYKRF